MIVPSWFQRNCLPSAIRSSPLACAPPPRRSSSPRVAVQESQRQRGSTSRARAGRSCRSLAFAASAPGRQNSPWPVLTRGFRRGTSRRASGLQEMAVTSITHSCSRKILVEALSLSASAVSPLPCLRAASAWPWSSDRFDIVQKFCLDRIDPPGRFPVDPLTVEPPCPSLRRSSDLCVSRRMSLF